MGIFTNQYRDVRPASFLIAGALAVVSLVAGHRALNRVEYSSGSRVGVINKMSEKGLFWKSYEGQMALEELIGGESTSANVWDFSIDAQARHGEDIKGLAKSVNDALKSGQKVRIEYIQGANLLPIYVRGKTTYYIQSVEPLAKSEK